MHSHPDPDSLALHALGEPALTGVDLTHIASCPGCVRSLAAMRDTVDLVRGAAHQPLQPAAVPERVWDAVATELGLSQGVRALARRSGATGATGAAQHPSEQPRRVRRQRGRWAAGLAIAAAGAAVGVAGTLLSGGTGGQEVLLARSEVLGVAGGDAAGEARLLSAEDGARRLELEFTGMPPSDGSYHEAWLIDPGSGAIVSLGPVDLSSDVVSLTVPRGLDPDVYSLVDVSAEPYDGDPSHSGVSLVQGSLGV